MKACLTEVNEVHFKLPLHYCYTNIIRIATIMQKLNCDRTVHTYPMYHPMPYSECMKTQYGPITAHPNRITQQVFFMDGKIN